MKKINSWSFLLIILGLLVWVLDILGLFIKITSDPLNSGYASLLIAWPLILVGLILGIIGFFIKKN